MKKILIASMLTGFAFFNVHAANVAFDDASSAVYSDGWATGDNGGNGFGPWTLNTVTSSGNFAGSFHGSTAVSTQSFGLWANGSTASSSATRSLTGGLLTAGQTISFDVGHTPTINGSIGFSLLAGGNGRITWKFTGGQSTWQMNDGGDDFGIAQNYVANTPISFSFTYNGGNSYSYSFGTASGNNFTTADANRINAIDGISFWNNNQGENQNFGVDNLRVVPEPSSASLMVLGISGLLAFRRRRNA